MKKSNNQQDNFAEKFASGIVTIWIISLSLLAGMWLRKWCIRLWFIVVGHKHERQHGFMQMCRYSSLALLLVVPIYYHVPLLRNAAPPGFVLSIVGTWLAIVVVLLIHRCISERRHSALMRRYCAVS